MGNKDHKSVSDIKDCIIGGCGSAERCPVREFEYAWVTLDQVDRERPDVRRGGAHGLDKDNCLFCTKLKIVQYFKKNKC